MLCRVHLGAIFIHLTVHAQGSEVRRSALRTLEAAVARHPKLVHVLVRESLTAALIRDPLGPAKPAAIAPTSTSDEREKPPVDKQSRYAALLLCCASLKNARGIDDTLRDTLLADLVVLSHHITICTS